MFQPDPEMTTENTYFKSISHQERFLEAVISRGKIWPEAGGKFDTEYATAIYILTADSSVWSQAASYVRSRGIQFEQMLEEQDFSGGYSRLVKLAGNLFNNQQHLDPIELLHLDHDNFQVALEALKIRRYGFRPN